MNLIQRERTVMSSPRLALSHTSKVPSTPVEVRLLGPVEVNASGAVLPVTGLRRGAVLAVLALRAGEVVTVDQLIDSVWEGEPPATATNTLQSHISTLRLRYGLGSSLQPRRRGYVLEHGTTDLQAAERLIREGMASADAATAAAKLRTALSLWRGPSLAELNELRRLAEQADRLDRLRIAAQQALHDARLRLGEHAVLVGELEYTTQLRPFDEAVHRQLMLALYLSGRQGDALAVYRRIRTRLNEELGVEPCPMLREIQNAILRHDYSFEEPRAKSLVT